MTSPPTTLTGDQTTPEPEGHTPDDAPVAPPTRFPHLRALDGLRGFAVVLVVFSHFTPDLTPGGFLGVDLFFLLSGFLITSLLVSEWDGNNGIALGRFWVRRARRLFPALLLVLAVVGLHGLLFSSPSENHQLGLDGLASLFYVANWRFIVSGQSYVMQFIQTDPSPLRHMWSLAIEEQFYVLWPLVVLATGAVVRKLGLRGRHGRMSVRPALAVVSIVLAVASAAWMVFLYRRGADLDRLYYGTDTRVFMILVGAAIGAIAAGRPQVPRAFRCAGDRPGITRGHPPAGGHLRRRDLRRVALRRRVRRPGPALRRRAARCRPAGPQPPRTGARRCGRWWAWA